jgi:putative zinc finger protein
MTHAEAEETQAVERYLLGELSDDERDQFEAHLFDCLTCAEDLKDAATFVDTSRDLLRSTRSAAVADPGTSVAAATRAGGPRRRWLTWLDLSSLQPVFAAAVPAFLIVLGFALYQNLVTIPALRDSSSPRALSSFSFVSSGARAGGTPLVIDTPPRQPFLMFFDIPPGGHYASYHCAIVRDDTNTPEVSVEVSAEQARDTVQMFVPASRLHAGSHTLVITGDPQHEIARYPFVLQGSH